MEPSEGEDWLGARKAAYLRWMKILAVLAIVLNVVAEAHYRQITSFRLPATVALVVSYLAAASDRLAEGCARTLPLLSRSPPSPAGKSALPEAEPLTLASRTILPARQR